MRTTVAVIGAGAAGLACAQRLRNRGVDCVVFEARDRIGGRIHSVTLGADVDPAELGAQVVHGDKAACWEVLGDPAEHVRYGVDAELSVRLGGRLQPAWRLARAAGCLLWSGDARIVASEAGDVAADAALQAAGGRPGIDEWIQQTWAASPARLSVLGMRDVRSSADAGESEFTVTGGFARLPQLLADGVPVRLGAAVSSVGADGTVQVGDEVVQAAAVVVTVAPSVIAAGRCTITDLPADKRRAAAALRLGDAVSVAVRLAEPAPVSGLVFDADAGAGFWRTTAGSPVALGVSKGPSAPALRALVADGAALRDALGQLLPWAAPASVLDVAIADWGDDPWAGGCFTYPAVGALDAPAVWARPMGRVFFAGEATCGARHPASVHGAMESGRRAAAEVVEAL